MYRKWVNGSFQNLCLRLKIIVALLFALFSIVFTEVPDLRSSVITLKVLWFDQFNPDTVVLVKSILRLH